MYVRWLPHTQLVGVSFSSFGAMYLRFFDKFASSSLFVGRSQYKFWECTPAASKNTFANNTVA